MKQLPFQEQVKCKIWDNPLATDYEVPTEPSCAGGRVHFRTALGQVVCYDPRREE